MASSPFKAAPGTSSLVPPSSLNLLPGNPRKGDVPAIMASLRRHSQYAPITANIGTHTGRPMEVLKGNHTTRAFRELAEADPDDPRWHKIAVFWVDVDEDMANRIVVADNQIGQLGGFDTDSLVGLLGTFGADIEGLGFTDADIEALTALNEEPSGAPGSGDLLDPPDEDNYTHQYAVTVICANEAEQQEVYENLRDAGMTVKVVTV